MRMSNQKSYVFAATTEVELNQWLEKLALAVHASKLNDERKLFHEKGMRSSLGSYQRDGKLILLLFFEAELSSDFPSYGTLRSLEKSLNPQLTRYARETEASIAAARRDNRNLLFLLCPALPSPRDGPDAGSHSTAALTGSASGRVEPYREKFGRRILVKCESIKFRLQAPVDGDKGPPGQVFSHFGKWN